MSHIKQTLPDSGEGDQRDEEAALLLRDMLRDFAFRMDGVWWVADSKHSTTMQVLYRTYEHCKSYGLVEDVTDPPKLESVHFFRFTPPLPEAAR